MPAPTMFRNASRRVFERSITLVLKASKFFQPEEPVDLEDKAKVRLVVETARQSATDDEDQTGWKTAMELMGCIEDAPADMAENHDKYLYGSRD